MVGAYRILKKSFPDLTAIVSRFPTVSEQIVGGICNGTDISLFSGPLTELLKRVDVALVTSGTATLETALMAVPHVIVYKTSILTYTLFKYFVTIPYIGLPNIIAEDLIAPECIQKYVSDKSLAEAVRPFLADGDVYKKAAENLFKIRKQLGSEKPSEVVSRIIRSYHLYHG